MSQTLLSNMYHAWGNMLCDSLVEMFPRPARNEMLRAYPSRFYESNGDAKVKVLLDVFEVFTLKHRQIRMLRPVPDAFPGRISDPELTDITKICRQVHYGNKVQVDKGYDIKDC